MMLVINSCNIHTSVLVSNRPLLQRFMPVCHARVFIYKIYGPIPFPLIKYINISPLNLLMHKSYTHREDPSRSHQPQCAFWHLPLSGEIYLL